MSGLHRTRLTTSQKVEFSAKAVADKTVYGKVSQLSQQYHLSRPTVYQTQKSIEQLLKTHYSQSESAHQAVTVAVDERQLQRAIIALRVIAPNSIRRIEDLLPIIYPGINPSYGSIQSLLSEAETQAARVNATVDLSSIKHSALDEMYSQGSPVLAGIDLDSGYVHSLQLKSGRTGSDWADVLDEGKQQGLDLSIVVKDAAVGIESGVNEVFPRAQQRDDCFHVLYDTNKVRRRLRSRAYNAIEYEYTQVKKLGKIRTKDQEKRKEQRERINRAKRESEKRIEQYDSFATANRLIRESMEYVDPDTGQRYTGDDVEKMMQTAADKLATIAHGDCQKLATYIRNRSAGIALAAQALSEQLERLDNHYTAEHVDIACLIIRLADTLKTKTNLTRQNRPYRYLLGLYAQLTHQLDGNKVDNLLTTIKNLLEKRYRASSAIEGFNAALRPYLYVHKGVTQSFLELFRAYYNTRNRRWGRHKNTSAHECITGELVTDWLSMIGYPASQANSPVIVH